MELRSVISVLDALGFTLTLEAPATPTSAIDSKAPEPSDPIDLDTLLDEYNKGTL